MKNLEVVHRKDLTADTVEFTIRSKSGETLTPFGPGSHITIETPSGAMRRYSLVNDGSNPTEYLVAIKLEQNSRGGSASMHNEVVVGTTLRVSEPENEFYLDETAEKYLLIAGGIGITPILGMANRLIELKKPFELIYCTRSPDVTAYLEEVTALPNTTVHHSYGVEDDRYDFWDHFETPSPTAVYCCGPAGLIEEIQALSGHWSENQIHFEDFAGVEAIRPDDREFQIHLAKSNMTLTVPKNKSILEVLRDTGIEMFSSCESGTCGTCKVSVLEGNVDHRDLALMDDQKANSIMVCVSRAQDGDLTLDL